MIYVKTKKKASTKDDSLLCDLFSLFMQTRQAKWYTSTAALNFV